ncbi:MAG: type VI secretion system contractile sheath large subunit [Pseudomonadota bacterium]
MARTNVSSGNFTFKPTANLQEPQVKRSAAGAFHIAIIGDFSGRGSRGEGDIQSLSNRKVIAVDRDNLEQVFSQLKVSLRTPFSEADLDFHEFDSLHPDYLLEHLDLFSKFNTLKNRLKKPDQFAAIVAEMQALKIYPDEQSASVQGANLSKNPVAHAAMSEAASGNNTLDAILAGAQLQQNTCSDIGDINQYIKQLVAPYAQAKADPRLPEMLNAVNEAMAQILRDLMHNSAFQELEANWRGLDFLTRRIETNANVKLFMIDATRDELIQDALAHDDIEDSAFYKRIVSSYQVPGKIHCSCLQVNLTLTTALDDLHLAFNLAHMAAATGAIALMAGSESLAGCASLAGQPEVADWRQPPAEEFSSAWKMFRESELSRYIALVSPRFLLRLPYGKKTSPIDTFDFSELPETHNHHYYLWGNSAHLVTLILANNFLQFGANANTKIASEIDELPLHTYQDDMDFTLKPCAEILVTDSAVRQLEASGLLVVRSIQGKAAVQIPALRTVSGQIIFS